MRLVSRFVALALALIATLVVLTAPAAAADSMTLSGTISAPAGQTGAVAGTEVSVRMPGTTVQVAYTQADADGKYRIENLTPGVYDLRFAPPAFSGFGVTLLTNEALTADRRLDLQLVSADSAVWSGTVREGSGAVIPYARVVVGQESGYADASGRFSVRADAGRHEVLVQGMPVRDGLRAGFFQLQRSEFELEGSLEQDVVIPTVDVRVRAVGPSGSPVVGATVDVFASRWFYGGDGPVAPPLGSVDYVSGASSGSVSPPGHGNLGVQTRLTGADGSTVVVMPRSKAMTATGRLIAPTETTLPILEFQIASLDADQTKAFSFSRSVVDPDPPTVTCDTDGLGEGSWSQTPPTITCTAEDDGTGLADPDDHTVTVTPQVPEDEDEYEGTYPAVVRVCDKADNCTEQTIPVKVDTKAPTLEGSVPSAGGSYPQGSTVEIRYTCRDAGSGVKRCRPRTGNEPGTPLDTSTPGHYVIIVECEDEAGNVREEEIPYEVTPTDPTDPTNPEPVSRDDYLDVVAEDQPTVLWNASGGADLGSGPALSYANHSGSTTASGLFSDDQAARFVGSPTYAYGNGLQAPSGDYTLEAWVRPTSAGQTATIMGQGSAGWLLLRGGTPVFRAVDREIQGGSAPTERWTHVVGTWSKGEKVARLYVDGVLVASGSAPTAPSGGATFYLGYGEHAQWFAGGIDEPAVYGRALSAERVAAHFAAGSVPATPADVSSTTGDAPDGGSSGGGSGVAPLNSVVPFAAPSTASAPAPEGHAAAAPSVTESHRPAEPQPRDSAGAPVERAGESSDDRVRSSGPGVATVSLRRASRGRRQAVVRCPKSKQRTTCRGRLDVRARSGRKVKSMPVAVRSGTSKTVRVSSRAASVRFVPGRNW